MQRNATIKAKVVQQDEFEKNERRLLNFGHTLGHALENQYELMHGQAVSIGMTYACHISKQLTGFKQTEKVVKVLEQYQLPTYMSFDKQKAFVVIQSCFGCSKCVSILVGVYGGVDARMMGEPLQCFVDRVSTD